MLYLGHHFLNREREKTQAYRALTMFYALRQLKLISESQRRRLHTSSALLTLLLEEAASYRVTGKAVKQHLIDLIGSSPRNIILIVDPGDQLRYPRIFGGNGYLMMLTDAGEQYATGLEDDYRDRLTPQLLAQGWKDAKQDLRNRFVYMSQRTEGRRS